MNDEKMPFLKHLEKFRKAILYSLALIILTSCLCYPFAKKITALVIDQLPQVVFITPFEVLIVYLKVAFFCGCVTASPIIFLIFWRFITPGLSRRERGYLGITFPLAFLLFLGGFYFAYFVLVPVSRRFLLSFATERIVPMISINRYVSFVGALCIFCGLFFQMPLASALLTKMKILTTARLISQWRHILIGIIILAAVVTPTTDIFNQILLAGPMLVLYGISIMATYFIEKICCHAS